MNEQKTITEKIKKIVQSLIEKIDNAARISVSDAKDGVVEININSDDAETMIGAGGETLRAVRHLARVMARKTFGEPVFIEIDINGYLEKKKITCASWRFPPPMKRRWKTRKFLCRR